MATVLGNFIPLALGSIAPVLITLVILVLGTPNGLTKAVSFVVGKMAAYAVLIALVFYFGNKVQDSQGESGESVLVSSVKLIAGILLLILAVKTILSQPDPDAPPPKLQTKIENMGPLPSFGIGFGISFIQMRYVLLLFAGVGYIRDADMGTGSNTIASLILVLALTWPLVVPIIVYLAMGDRRDAVMASMNSWLDRHSRVINIVVLTLFGLVLLRAGLQGLL